MTNIPVKGGEIEEKQYSGHSDCEGEGARGKLPEESAEQRGVGGFAGRQVNEQELAPLARGLGAVEAGDSGRQHDLHADQVEQSVQRAASAGRLIFLVVGSNPHAAGNASRCRNSCGHHHSNHNQVRAQPLRIFPFEAIGRAHPEKQKEH